MQGLDLLDKYRLEVFAQILPLKLAPAMWLRCCSVEMQMMCKGSHISLNYHVYSHMVQL